MRRERTAFLLLLQFVGTEKHILIESATIYPTVPLPLLRLHCVEIPNLKKKTNSTHNHPEDDSEEEKRYDDLDALDPRSDPVDPFQRIQVVRPPGKTATRRRRSANIRAPRVNLGRQNKSVFVCLSVLYLYIIILSLQSIAVVFCLYSLPVYLSFSLSPSLP